MMQISKKLKFKVIEKNIQLKEIKKFDESFVTATGWGICAVKSINKKIFTNQKKTKQIQKNFGDIVKIDIVEQYLNFLND